MSSDRHARPKAAPFFDAIDEMAKAEGLMVADLRAGDVIDVDTRNHRYTFILRDPAKGSAEATSDGAHITEPCDAVIAGSLLGSGSAIRPGWIGVGYALEVCAGGKRYILSRTRRIAVNGVTISPRAEGDRPN
ncbi:MAG: hypothetical protein RL272_683 [Candidatus Parcubacteria bacterium]|jgi:hypothetical protein